LIYVECDKTLHLFDTGIRKRLRRDKNTALGLRILLGVSLDNGKNLGVFMDI